MSTIWTRLPQIYKYKKNSIQFIFKKKKTSKTHITSFLNIKEVLIESLKGHIPLTLQTKTHRMHWSNVKKKMEGKPRKSKLEEGGVCFLVE